jgi:hypothetical protein
MSKQLYPKVAEPSKKHVASRENPLVYRYHVLYEDPSGQVPPEWKHYDSEAAVKADAFTKVRMVGFHTKATLYSTQEYIEMLDDVTE